MKIELKLKNGTGMYCDEVMVVGDGDLTYLWVGKDGNCVCNFSGPETLRKIARGILAALRVKSKRRRKAS